jgi:hypothetical protein
VRRPGSAQLSGQLRTIRSAPAQPCSARAGFVRRRRSSQERVKATEPEDAKASCRSAALSASCSRLYLTKLSGKERLFPNTVSWGKRRPLYERFSGSRSDTPFPVDKRLFGPVKGTQI